MVKEKEAMEENGRKQKDVRSSLLEQLSLKDKQLAQKQKELRENSEKFAKEVRSNYKMFLLLNMVSTKI